TLALQRGSFALKVHWTFKIPAQAGITRYPTLALQRGSFALKVHWTFKIPAQAGIRLIQVTWPSG
ncbi:MAG: hypothetical protein AAFO94_13600, partial [Bacteroidota bacterium]